GKGDGHDVPAAGRVLAQHLVQPQGHIGASHDGGAQGPHVLVGGGTGGPVRTVGAAEPDQAGDPVDQHGGLAAARSCQNQQGAAGGKNGLPLHLIQPAELLFYECIPQSTKFGLYILCHVLLLSYKIFLQYTTNRPLFKVKAGNWPRKKARPPVPEVGPRLPKSLDRTTCAYGRDTYREI